MNRNWSGAKWGRTMAGDEQELFFKFPVGPIDNGILRVLSGDELKVLLVHLRFRNSKTGWSYPSRETIAKITGLDVRRVSEVNRRLEKKFAITGVKTSERFAKVPGRFKRRKQYQVHLDRIRPSSADICNRLGKRPSSADICRDSKGRFSREASVRTVELQMSVRAVNCKRPSGTDIEQIEQIRTESPPNPPRGILPEPESSSPPLNADSAPPPPNPKPPLSEEEQKARDKQMEDLERQGINLPTCLQSKRKP